MVCVLIRLRFPKVVTFTMEKHLCKMLWKQGLLTFSLHTGSLQSSSQACRVRSAKILPSFISQKTFSRDQSLTLVQNTWLSLRRLVLLRIHTHKTVLPHKIWDDQFNLNFSLIIYSFLGDLCFKITWDILILQNFGPGHCGSVGCSVIPQTKRSWV